MECHMKNWARLVIRLTPLFLPLSVEAQSLPGPSMSIPEASSNRGFDLVSSSDFDYITSAKCSLLSTDVSCTSAGSSAFSISPAVMAQFDRLRLEVTVPFVDIEGPGTLSGALRPAHNCGPVRQPNQSPVRHRRRLGRRSVYHSARGSDTAALGACRRRQGAHGRQRTRHGTNRLWRSGDFLSPIADRR